jgi:eukaryotic-like serine/threonine-protein kinase
MNRMPEDPSNTPPNPALEGAPEPGELIAGKYVVESVLGVGGMGLVLSARHVQLNQSVAIKLLRPGAAGVSSVGRFLREARAAAAIRSEHVARVIDVGTLDSGLPFIVMERLAGCDLAALLAARGRVPCAEAVSLVLQACEAVGEAHALGIIHRDLKPSNLFVTTRMDGSPLLKVLDFGISKIQNPTAFTEADPTLTASGSVLGSPAYMSPEQIRSGKATDARSDVWAMGVILYELIAGQSPFVGETIGDTLVKIASEPAPALKSLAPDIPQPVADLVARCMIRDPEQRTGSIAELARGLQPFAAVDMSALVDRIVKVAATARPVSMTPKDADVAMARSPDSRAAEEGPRATAKSGRRGALLAVGAGLVLVGALAWVRGTRSPFAARAGDEAPVERGSIASTGSVQAAPIQSAVVAIPPAPVAAPDAGAASPVDASAPPARAADRRVHHHGSSPAPSAAAPATSALAAPTPAPRSLDDLLEGRH